MSKPLIVETAITIEPTPKEKPKPKSTSKIRKTTSNGSVEVVGSSFEQCVVFAKRITGITKSIGYAGTAKVEGTEPKVGSIALERNVGHAVVVEAILDNGINIIEANFVKGKITRRFIAFSNIRGYIY